MKWTIGLVIAAALLLPGTATAATATKRCGRVAFTPNSEDWAADIRATGLTCGLARDFVKDSNGRPGRRSRAFTCTSTARGDGRAAVPALPVPGRR